MSLLVMRLRPSLRLQYVVGLLLFSALLCGSAEAKTVHTCGTAELAATVRVEGFVFRSYEALNADDLACMLVYRQGRVVYRMASDKVKRYDFGQPGDTENKIPRIEDGTDLAGRGHADMIVSSWSGGMHCCIVRYVFELEPKLRVIAKIDDGDSDLGHFEKLSDGSGYEYLTGDIWSYWPGSFASSVGHSVMLGWDNDVLRLDLERMKAPAPTPQQWKDDLTAVNAVANDSSAMADSYSDPLWDKVLNLIDSGHSKLAWKFVREVNPAALSGNYVSLADFCDELAGSRYWSQLRPTLRGVPRECSAAIAKRHVARR